MSIGLALTLCYASLMIGAAFGYVLSGLLSAADRRVSEPYSEMQADYDALGRKREERP